MDDCRGGGENAAVIVLHPERLDTRVAGAYPLPVELLNQVMLVRWHPCRNVAIHLGGKRDVPPKFLVRTQFAHRHGEVSCIAVKPKRLRLDPARVGILTAGPFRAARVPSGVRRLHFLVSSG